jgi:hypothetical protein
MTFRLKLAAMIAATGVACSSGRAHAWHEQGHMMVAAVAWEQMTSAVRARAIQLLKINPDYNKWISGVADDLKDKTAFMRAAVWPDDIKNPFTHGGFKNDGDTPPKTKQAGQNIGYADKRMHKYWHYKDVPFSPDGTKTFRAPSVNAETQIRRFTAAISKPGVSDNIKSYDVVWLIHMVGDVHQPLHTTSRFTKAFKTKEGDRGGNSVRIDCCGSKLHTYWDGVVGDSREPKDAAAAAATLSAAPAAEAAISDPGAWILESFKIAKTYVYMKPPIETKDVVSNLTPAYKSNAEGVARARISLAGARLARLFNDNLK